jgi:stress response protein SCP2
MTILFIVQLVRNRNELNVQNERARIVQASNLKEVIQFSVNQHGQRVATHCRKAAVTINLKISL